MQLKYHAWGHCVRFRDNFAIAKEKPNASFHSLVYPCHTVSFIMWKMMWHGIQRREVPRFWFIHEALAKDLKEFNKLWSVFVFFPPQSAPKNMKSDLEISPRYWSVGIAHQGNSLNSCRLPRRNWRVFITNQDKLWRKMTFFNCCYSSSCMNTNLLREHAISLRLGRIKTCPSLLPVQQIMALLDTEVFWQLIFPSSL